MDISEYQFIATETSIYGAGNKITYPILGLLGEAGEIANKYKKVLRDDQGILYPSTKDALSKELGDVLWYIAALATDLGLNLDEVAKENLNKLKERKEKGTISGSGDNR